MMPENLMSQLEILVTPLCQEANLELVDIQLKRYHQDYLIEIIADRPQGGISIDECAGLNRRIINKIDETKLLSDYSVDVSSPGLDWPLRTKKDFSRVLNREVRLILEKTAELKGEYVGILRNATEENIVIEIQNGILTIPVHLIKKAVQNI